MKAGARRTATPFSLRDAWAQKNAAVGRVLRGLYLGLAILLAAAMYSTHSILTALGDGAVGIVLMLLVYKIYDLIDRRDFARELADDWSVAPIGLRPDQVRLTPPAASWYTGGSCDRSRARGGLHDEHRPDQHG